MYPIPCKGKGPYVDNLDQEQGDTGFTHRQLVLACRKLVGYKEDFDWPCNYSPYFNGGFALWDDREQMEKERTELLKKRDIPWTPIPDYREDFVDYWNKPEPPGSGENDINHIAAQNYPQNCEYCHALNAVEMGCKDMVIDDPCTWDCLFTVDCPRNLVPNRLVTDSRLRSYRPPKPAQ